MRSCTGRDVISSLYHSGEETEYVRVAFFGGGKARDVWNMTVLGDDFSGLEYCFEIDGKVFADPYGRQFTDGRSREICRCRPSHENAGCYRGF